MSDLAKELFTNDQYKKVILKNYGDAKLADTGVRAGSTLTQDTALRNLLSFTKRPVEEILPMLSENPAKLLGIFESKGSIDNGKNADIVILNDEYQVCDVFVAGKLFEK